MALVGKQLIWMGLGVGEISEIYNVDISFLSENIKMIFRSFEDTSPKHLCLYVCLCVWEDISNTCVFLKHHDFIFKLLR